MTKKKNPYFFAFFFLYIVNNVLFIYLYIVYENKEKRDLHFYIIFLIFLCVLNVCVYMCIYNKIHSFRKSETIACRARGFKNCKSDPASCSLHELFPFKSAKIRGLRVKGSFPLFRVFVLKL